MGAPKAGARPMTGKYRGYDPDGTTTDVADYFGNCSVCGALIDTRDLCMILAHLHGAEIEVGEGPTPPRREESMQ
jgi:hypothetical protein